MCVRPGPVYFSEEELQALWMMLVIATATVVLVFYTSIFIVNRTFASVDLLWDMITPESRKVAADADIGRILNATDATIHDLRSLIQMLNVHKAAYEGATEVFIRREDDRIAFEEKVMEWTKKR